MRILHVASEVAPFSKTGGLGEVMGALPGALCDQGIDVRVATPLYGFIDRSSLTFAGEQHLHLAQHSFHVRLWRHAAKPGHAETIFIDVPGLLDRPLPYGDYADNPLRFGVFCKAAATLARQTGAELVHLHDWQAALTALFLRDVLPKRAVVQTVHNLSFQGLCGTHWADMLEVPHIARDFHGLEFHGQLSFLKAGLVLADRITTVSPTYAREILSEPGGQQLSGLLSHRQRFLRGILNGIDTADRDPATDKALPAPFDADAPGGKAACRDALLNELHLEPTDGPVFGVVSRASSQKGLDLVADAIAEPGLGNARFALMCDGEPDLVHRLADLAHARPGRIALTRSFDEGLARRVYAGSDFVLAPSRFEPCGLTQMFAMRYGAVPIVRRTGGLADTVTDGVTGLTFFDPEAWALRQAISRAQTLYTQRADFERIRESCMRADWSWTGPARAYRELYAELLGPTPAPPAQA